MEVHVLEIKMHVHVYQLKGKPTSYMYFLHLVSGNEDVGSQFE